MSDYEDLATAIRRCPFHRLLDIVPVPAHDESAVRISLDIRPDFWRSDDGGGLHGGVIASLVDVAATYAVMRTAGRPAVTAALTVDYLRPVSGSRAEAEARVVRTGRTTALADVEFFDGTVLAAVGRARFAFPEPA